MSFSGHLTVETTSFQPIFDKEWFTDPETQALTEALHQTISVHTQSVSTSGTASEPEPEPEPEPVFKQPRPPPPAKKITKRKSRASNRSLTTFIVADPENFRQMVQQVTGIRFEPGSVQHIVKPETHRPSVVNRIPPGCLLPTLDTSAFLLDHHQEVVGPTAVVGGSGNGSFGFGSIETGRVGFDFDGLPSFPTLESWKVM